jgi:hypothetical protein
LCALAKLTNAMAACSGWTARLEGGRFESPSPSLQSHNMAHSVVAQAPMNRARFRSDPYLPWTCPAWIRSWISGFLQPPYTGMSPAPKASRIRRAFPY